MKKEIVKLNTPELEVIEESKANQIRATFEPMAKMLTEFEESYNDIITEAEKEVTSEITLKAKRLRLDIGKVRIETEKLRKEQKEEYLRAGKAIDGVSNILKWAVSDKENKLKEIENHFEIQEQKRLERLQLDRAEKLSKYVEDAYDRNLSAMDDDVWQAYLQTKKKEHEDRIAAEKKAEQDRIAKEKAEAEERERIRKENERLKKEAEEREEKQRKEKEAYGAKLKEEREKRERAEREEKERREKLEAELKAKQEAEEKQRKEAEEKIQAELNKGDVEKVKDLINDLKQLKTKYVFKSAKNKKMYESVSILIDKVIGHINK